jgi:RNA polymerase sigma factor for flagellar operon FliA
MGALDRKAASASLWRRYRDGREPGTRNLLVADHLGLVHRAAREAIRHGVDLDDLVGAGTVGLIQAIEGFDPDRGFAFSTYAMPRIRGAILDEVRGQDWMPRSVRVRRRQIDRAEARLQQQLGGNPAPAQLADALGLDLTTFWRWWDESRGRAIVRLDDPSEDGSPDAAHGERVADDGAPDPPEVMAHAQLLERVRQCLLGLSERDRLVLTLYHYERLTLREIGRVLGVSESRVCQVHGRALRMLRSHLDSGPAPSHRRPTRPGCADRAPSSGARARDRRA